MFKHSHNFVAAAMLVLCTSLLSAQTPPAVFVVPTIKILGAESPVEIGDIVDLSVSKPATASQWLASSSYIWRVLDGGKVKKVHNYDGGVIFGTGLTPRQVMVDCVATHLFIVKDGDKVTQVATRTVILTTMVTIGAPVPPSPIPPNPVPPAPAFPDGTYKLSQAAYTAAMTKVTDVTARVKGAAALAKSCRGLQSTFAAGGAADLATALKQSKTVNNQALKDAGVDLTKWDDFGGVLQDAIYQFYKDKKLNTPADLGVMWGEVAVGLEGVK